MARRELSDRHAGQTLGLVWMILHTVFLISIYVLLFSYILRIKLDSNQSIPRDYTTYILAGLITWLPFLESLTKSTSIITSHINLVKQTVFPLEVLPIKAVLASLTPLLVSFPILLGYVVINSGPPPLSYFLFPVVLLMQTALMLGLSYFFSAAAVHFRDLREVIQSVSMVLPYVVPIFYSPSSVPESLRFILYLNPFSYLVWCYQDILYYGSIQHTYAWAVLFAISIGTLILGFRFFMKLKPTFGNVL